MPAKRSEKRPKDGPRWVSLNELAAETGDSVRNLQYIRQKEPGVLVTRQKGSGTEYKQPDCAVNLRNRAVEHARRESAPLVSLDEARTRKALAEAETAELALAKAREQMVTVEDYGAAIGRLLDRLVALARALPNRLARFGPEVVERAEAEVETLIAELHGMDEDMLEEQTDPGIEDRAA